MSEGTNSTTTSSWLVDIVDAAGNGSGNYQDYDYYGRNQMKRQSFKNTEKCKKIRSLSKPSPVDLPCKSYIIPYMETSGHTKKLFMFMS